MLNTPGGTSLPGKALVPEIWNLYSLYTWSGVNAIEICMTVLSREELAYEVPVIRALQKLSHCLSSHTLALFNSIVTAICHHLGQRSEADAFEVVMYRVLKSGQSVPNAHG